MKVEIWADVICPWCGLGRHRLLRALDQLGHQDQVEVVYRSFQLDPSFPSDATIPVRQMLRDRYGWDDTHIEAANGRIEAMAEAEGLVPYVVLENTIGNTQLTHELLAHATAEGKHSEAWQAMFQAHFGEVRPIFDVDSLVALGGELGLDSAETRQAFTDRRFRQQVDAEARRARELGANGVPFILIDDEHAVTGAQDTDSLLASLRQVWEAVPR